MASSSSPRRAGRIASALPSSCKTSTVAQNSGAEASTTELKAHLPGEQATKSCGKLGEPSRMCSSIAASPVVSPRQPWDADQEIKGLAKRLSSTWNPVPPRPSVVSTIGIEHQSDEKLIVTRLDSFVLIPELKLSEAHFDLHENNDIEIIDSFTVDRIRDSMLVAVLPKPGWVRLREALFSIKKSLSEEDQEPQVKALKLREAVGRYYSTQRSCTRPLIDPIGSQLRPVEGLIHQTPEILAMKEDIRFNTHRKSISIIGSAAQKLVEEAIIWLPSDHMILEDKDAWIKKNPLKRPDGMQSILRKQIEENKLILAYKMFKDELEVDLRCSERLLASTNGKEFYHGFLQEQIGIACKAARVERQRYMNEKMRSCTSVSSIDIFRNENIPELKQQMQEASKSKLPRQVELRSNSEIPKPSDQTLEIGQRPRKTRKPRFSLNRKGGGGNEKIAAGPQAVMETKGPNTMPQKPSISNRLLSSLSHRPRSGRASGDHQLCGTNRNCDSLEVLGSGVSTQSSTWQSSFQGSPSKVVASHESANTEYSSFSLSCKITKAPGG